MNKKILFSALVSVAAISLSSLAIANNNSGNLYAGLQGGYGDTHWDDLFSGSIANTSSSTTLVNVSSRTTGFAGRGYIGYDYNQYLGIETGFTYFPKTTVNIAGVKAGSLNTYGGDLLGKVTVPFVQNVGLFAKAGPGYLRTTGSDGLSGKTSNIDLVYGFGANYAFTPHLIADVGFLRYNGNHKQTSTDYQPNADLYAIGLTYKFV